MPTYIKVLPSKETLLENYYIENGFICWKDKVISRGRKSERAGRRITTYRDESNYYRVAIKGTTYALSRVVYQMTHGDLTPEYEVDHIDRNIDNNYPSNLRKVLQEVNKRNKPSQRNNSTDFTGVCLNKKFHPKPYQHKFTEYYVARWYDSEGVLHGKNFNISKLGKEEAFSLACEYRKKMIEELNQAGAGYTEDHGM